MRKPARYCPGAIPCPSYVLGKGVRIDRVRGRGRGVARGCDPEGRVDTVDPGCVPAGPAEPVDHPPVKDGGVMPGLGFVYRFLFCQVYRRGICGNRHASLSRINHKLVTFSI
jgi:hypothetical protein